MDNLDKQKFIFGSLFLIANRLQVIGDHYLGKDDMTTKQWFLSAIISQFEKPPTLSEVAEIMGSSRQNIKQLALKLCEKEFLIIEKDDQDARALRLKLTEKSRLFWEKREKNDNEFIDELFSDLNGNEIDALFSSFKKLAERIEKMGTSLFKAL